MLAARIVQASGKCKIIQGKSVLTVAEIHDDVREAEKCDKEKESTERDWSKKDPAKPKEGLKH